MRELAAAADVVAAEHALMRGVGLTAGPVRALRALGESGAQSMKALAERLGCDKSYVTGLVKPLLAKELVTLEPDPADGRVKVVTLTPEGSAVAAEAQRVHEAPPAAMRTLSEADQRELARLLGVAAGTGTGDAGGGVAVGGAGRPADR